jgi:hypothetical protein
VVDPCSRLVFARTSVRNFVTWVVPPVVHTVLECTCLAVGIRVEETVVGHSCTPSVTFGGNIKERLTWACLGDRTSGEGKRRTGSEFVLDISESYHFQDQNSSF